MVKTLVRQSLAAVAGSMSWASRRLRGRVCVLTYHRVLRPAQVKAIRPQPGMYVTRDTFEQHLRFLSEQTQVLGLDELLDRWQQGTLDNRVAHTVITFDDGWIDTYEEAFPVLQAYRLPATVFLPTAFIGTTAGFWPDRVLAVMHRLDASADGAARDAFRAAARLTPKNGARFGDSTDEMIEYCKRLPVDARASLLDRLHEFGEERHKGPQVIDWAQAAEMVRHRITFGSHTHTHALLTQLGDEEAEQELRTSWSALAQLQQGTVPVIAYPNGNVDTRIAAIARRCGYRAGVSCEFGSEGAAPDDAFRVRRVGIHQDITASADLFAYHIAGGNRLLSWS